MDGLLADSEPLHYQAMNRVFQSYGKHFTKEDNINLYYGLPDLEAARDMVARFNLPLSAGELVLQKEKEGEKLLTRVKPMPGLLELLQKLKAAGIKMAIASSSKLATIKVVVNAVGVAGYFQFLSSVDRVENGKPAPDVYLLAAKRLGVAPEDCLVLEDSPAGVLAAVAAGMTVFAIPGKEIMNGDFSQANKVLNSLDEVIQFI